MKIATHNLLFLFDKGMHSHSGEEWEYSSELVEARVAHFGGLFAEIDADVVFLQELASESVLKRIIESSGIAYSYFLAEPDVNGVGNAVIYKGTCECFSIPATSALPVFVEGDADMLAQRIFSRRDFVGMNMEYAGRLMLMLGLHLKAGFLVAMKDSNGRNLPIYDQLSAADGLIRSEFFRFAQARKAREVIDRFLVENPDGDVVVAGDFNARDGDVLLRIVQGVLKGVDDSLADTADWLPGLERVSFGGRKLVDHILISSRMAAAICDVRILNQGEKPPKDVSPTPAAIGSDHPPLVVDLDI